MVVGERIQEGRNMLLPASASAASMNTMLLGRLKQTGNNQDWRVFGVSVKMEVAERNELPNEKEENEN